MHGVYQKPVDRALSGWDTRGNDQSVSDHRSSGRSSANGDGPIIVHVNPDENERRALVADLGIDEHTLNSAADPDELARMEFEPDCAVLIYKRPRNYSSTQQMVFGVVSAGRSCCATGCTS